MDVVAFLCSGTYFIGSVGLFCSARILSGASIHQKYMAHVKPLIILPFPAEYLRSVSLIGSMMGIAMESGCCFRW